ncbi:MAG: hypothetical protein AAGD00_08435 [Planctomycetota bacterium]
MDDPPTRQATENQQLSPLAVLSLGGALLSFATCLVGGIASVLGFPSVGLVILFLPLLALASAVCGVLALVAINRSDGLLVGGVPARIGLVLGLIATAVTGSFTFGALRTAYDVRERLAPVVEALIADINADNWPGAEEHLGEPVARALGKTGVAWFFETLEASFQSETVGADAPLVILFRSRGELARASDPTQVSAAPQNLNDEVPKPVRVTFASGASGVLFVFLDPAALASQQVRVSDAMIVLPDNRVLTLQPDGPASLLARGGGMRVVPRPAEVMP